jgi:rhodanese-related sulfurtransferase
VTVTLAALLAAARGRLRRVEPACVPDALARGAVLVDIRSSDQRRRDGVVEGAIWYPRNVLEWRTAPDAELRDPAFRAATELVLMCAEGFQSSLAAATLLDLGVTGATDVVGGFAGWRAAGLPVRPFDESVDLLQGSPDAPLRG